MLLHQILDFTCLITNTCRFSIDAKPLHLDRNEEADDRSQHLLNDLVESREHR
jgi:hypothetical protein